MPAGRIVGYAIGYMLLGALVAAGLTLLFVIVQYNATPSCGRAGDSGGCAMEAFANVVMSIPIGSGIGLLLGVWRAVRPKSLG